MPRVSYEYETDKRHADTHPNEIDKLIEQYASQGYELFRTEILQSYAQLWLFFRRPRKKTK